MTYCSKCGTKIDEGVKFCPGCGAAVEAPAAEQTEAQQAPPAASQNDFSAKIAALNNTADTTADFDKADIEQNKVMGILAYLSWLVLIPIFAAPKSKFARFHANQGLVLAIIEIAYGIVQIVLGIILRSIFPWSLRYGYLGGRGFIYNALTTVLGLTWIVFAVPVVIGLINAVNGRAKELPVIGKFKLLK